MRDSKRIKKFCDELAEIWETQCPDWRFNQLIENVWRANGFSMPFFIEDNKMLEGIRKMFNLEREEENEARQY